MAEAGEGSVIELSARDLAMSKKTGLGPEVQFIQDSVRRTIEGTKEAKTQHEPSTKDSTFLADLHDISQIDRNRERSDIQDLASLLKAEQDDHEQKFGASNRPKGYVNPWTTMYDTMTNIITNEPLTPKDRKNQEKIEIYLTKHITELKETTQKSKPGSEEQAKAAAEQKIFEQLRAAYDEKLYPKDQEKFADQPMDKEEPQKFMKELLPSPEEFAQYAIPLEETQQVLEKITESPTVEQLTAFYEALQMDIQAEKKQREQDPKWKAKKSIVQAADAFFRDHNEDEEKGDIYITAAADGSIRHVGWHTTAENESDTVDYILDPDGMFDPSSDRNDTKGLSYHLYNLDQFYLLHESLSTAKDALAKVKKGKKISPQESIAMRQLLQRFAGDKTEPLLEFVDKKTKIQNPKQRFRRGGKPL